MTTVRWACVEARTTCGRCGSPVPLSGPNRTPHCNACQSALSIPPSIWKSLLEDIEEDWGDLEEGQGQSSKIMTGGAEFSRDWYKVAPRCAKCKTALPIESIATGTDGKIHCPSCGTAAITYPAPDWMKEGLPTASQIVGGEREGGAATGEVAEVDRDAPQPIVMTCPQCGGALRITTESQRVTKCTFCSTDVFLPDDIWKRMHPVKTVAPWWIRLEGEGKAAEVEEEEDDSSDSSDEIPEIHLHEDDHTSGWQGPVLVVVLIGALVGLGYGGVWLASNYLQSNESSASGQFQGMGPTLGTFVLQPTTCTSGASEGFQGAVLRAADGHHVRVMNEPGRLHVVAATPSGLVVDFAGCVGVQGEVHLVQSNATGAQGWGGTVSVQCTAPSGDTLAGTASFEGCY